MACTGNVHKRALANKSFIMMVDTSVETADNLEGKRHGAISIVLVPSL